MILYKNVDIVDLESILQKGLLSLNESKNNNWDEGKRAENSCDVVYLFKPLTKENSFCNYGAALLEVDIPDEIVKENQLKENDRNKGKYIEYITEKVEAEWIQAIYIPVLFKSRVEKCLPEEVLCKIVWCKMKATIFDAEATNETGMVDCPAYILQQFAKTAEIMETCINFFRGVTEKNTMIDLYEIQYILK